MYVHIFPSTRNTIVSTISRHPSAAVVDMSAVPYFVITNTNTNTMSIYLAVMMMVVMMMMMMMMGRDNDDDDDDDDDGW